MQAFSGVFQLFARFSVVFLAFLNFRFNHSPNEHLLMVQFIR